MRGNFDKIAVEIELLREYCKQAEDIFPDTELYIGGRDIYISHVDHVCEEILRLIQNIRDGAKPTYTKKWVADSIKELKEQFPDE